MACMKEEDRWQHGKPCGVAVRTANWRSARSRAGHCRVAEGLVRLTMLGNANGGKEPWFKTDAGSDKELEIGKPRNSTRSPSDLRRVDP